jgi:hypothetical protein
MVDLHRLTLGFVMVATMEESVSMVETRWTWRACTVERRSTREDIVERIEFCRASEEDQAVPVLPAAVPGAAVAAVERASNPASSERTFSTGSPPAAVAAPAAATSAASCFNTSISTAADAYSASKEGH